MIKICLINTLNRGQFTSDTFNNKQHCNECEKLTAIFLPAKVPVKVSPPPPKEKFSDYRGMSTRVRKPITVKD